ncbi:MAG: isoamylase early set domain-containing protein [Planctomycetota bacterium]|jgi:1,4-alpha-glucan branching enzyme
MVKKTFSKTGRTCLVTFTVPRDIRAQKVDLCAEFNGWGRTPLTRRKDGRFSGSVTLESGRDYRFRYLFDGQTWGNDEDADKYMPNPFGSEDSILAL